MSKLNWELEMSARAAWVNMMQVGDSQKHLMEITGNSPALAEYLYDLYLCGFKQGAAWREDTCLKM